MSAELFCSATDAARFVAENGRLRAERDEAVGLLNANEDIAKGALVQRDSARALLREALAAIPHAYPLLRARIDKELGD